MTSATITANLTTLPVTILSAATVAIVVIAAYVLTGAHEKALREKRHGVGGRRG